MTEEEVRRLRQPFLPILDADGNVVGVQLRLFAPEIVYRAELVYFPDSRPREAELILDRPVKGPLVLHFDPAHPGTYTLEPPSYLRVWFLAAAGILFAWVWPPLP